MKVNAPLYFLIKKEICTQRQNYSFIEQDPLLLISANILALKYYIYVDAQNNFDYKLPLTSRGSPIESADCTIIFFENLILGQIKFGLIESLPLKFKGHGSTGPHNGNCN